MNATAKPEKEFTLKIYQCPDGSWRIHSQDYVTEWADYKLRNLTQEEVSFEIKKLITT